MFLFSFSFYLQCQFLFEISELWLKPNDGVAIFPGTGTRETGTGPGGVGGAVQIVPNHEVDEEENEDKEYRLAVPDPQTPERRVDHAGQSLEKMWLKKRLRPKKNRSSKNGFLSFFEHG